MSLSLLSTVAVVLAGFTNDRELNRVATDAVRRFFAMVEEQSGTMTGK